MSDFLVVVQLAEGAPHDVSLQCLTKARELADASGAKVAALVIGASTADAAAALGGYGADTVYTAEDARLDAYLTTPFTKVLCAFLEANPYPIVVLPGTTVGDDLAPMAAAQLGAACVLDADNLIADGGKVVAERLEFDRKVHTRYGAADGKSLLVTLKDGIAEVGAPDAGKQAEASAVDVALDDSAFAAKVLNRDVATKSVNLKDAKIIVGAGAGFGTEENFALAKQLAEKLGAEMGATRAVVDAGWLPADHQIGQTGATVKPDVYIACGISGAVQHWVGMSEAKTIIAVNIDKNAPIMKRAHYRIAGDLNAVLPQLIKLLG